jgi:hypothetical protein
MMNIDAISYTLTEVCRTRGRMNDVSDTSLEFQDMQIELLSKKNVHERLALTFALSEAAISLAQRALKRAMPKSSESDRQIKFIDIHYGKELSELYKTYIEMRRL